MADQSIYLPRAQIRVTAFCSPRFRDLPTVLILYLTPNFDIRGFGISVGIRTAVGAFNSFQIQKIEIMEAIRAVTAAELNSENIDVVGGLDEMKEEVSIEEYLYI